MSPAPPSGAPRRGRQPRPNGLSLTEDGRVFFDSTDQLAAADTDVKPTSIVRATGNRQPHLLQPQLRQPAGTCLALISTGTSTFDSGLLAVSANGTDAYFFTRDSLCPPGQKRHRDEDLRRPREGGFPFTLPATPCQASDECHGPGSPRAAGRSRIAGAGGNCRPRALQEGLRPTEQASA